MVKDSPSRDPKPAALSPSLDKILNEDRVGLAQEQRRKLRLMRVYVAVEFDQTAKKKW